MKLNILARQNNESEKIFYKNLNNKIKFIKRTKDYKKSYKSIDKAKLVVCLGSTLGYESISRGNKSLFLNLNEREINCFSYKKYSWPKKFRANGPFWTSQKNEEKIKNLLKNLLNMSSKEWKNTSKKYNTFKLYNNSILTNKINYYLR